jgi:pimeloyl-ACP methyl ester carboxylesterase
MFSLSAVRHGSPLCTSPAFVLIHGLASNARMWDGVGEALAAQDLGSVAIDLRGHGKSPKPPVADGYAMADVIGDVLAFFKAEGLVGENRPIVVGQSWGANVVIELAASYPESVRAVMGVDGGTIRLKDSYPNWDDCAREKAPPPWEGVTMDSLRQRMTAGHPDWTPQAIEGALAFAETKADGTVAPWLTLDRHLAVLRGLWDHDPIPAFARLNVPTVLAMADSPGSAWADDKRANVQRCLDVARSANVDVEWFVGGDHDLHAQYPQRIAELLITLHTATSQKQERVIS